MQNYPTTYKPPINQNATENSTTCHTVGIRDLRISDAVRAAGREGYLEEGDYTFIAPDPATYEEAPPPVYTEPEELSTNIRTSSNIGQLGALPWEVP